MEEKRTKEEYRAKISSPRGRGVKVFRDFQSAKLLTLIGLLASAAEKTGVNIDLFGPNTRFFRTLSDAYFMLQATWQVFAWKMPSKLSRVVFVLNRRYPPGWFSRFERWWFLPWRLVWWADAGLFSLCAFGA
jgi:hypothetical protein